MPWEKGQSGNPSGRPKLDEVLRTPIKEATPAHLVRLMDIAKNAQPKDAIAAIKLMWAYAYGQPHQTISSEDGGPVVDVAGIAAALNKAVGK